MATPARVIVEFMWVAAVSTLWVVRAAGCLAQVGSSADAKRPSLDAALGVAVAALVWWLYVLATDPTIVTLPDLLQGRHYVRAGGAMVPMTKYFGLLALVAAIGCSFVLAGHFVCRATRFWTVDRFAGADGGVYYFVGMATFLATYLVAAVFTHHTRLPALVIAVAFAAMSAYTVLRFRLWRDAKDWIVSNGRTILVLAPLVVATLCLLQFVVTTRRGPNYEEFAHFIVTENRLPLLNRHFGQSLLASVGLMAVGNGTVPYANALVLINNWLYVSHVGLMLLLFRFLRELSVSRAGAASGVVMLMVGNSALSLLPFIVYDHDYPLLLNIYTDSVFGIGGYLTILLYLLHIHEKDDDTEHRRWFDTGSLVPAAIMLAFNCTAELNAVMVFLAFGVFIVVNVWRRTWTWTLRRMAPLAAVCGLATLIGAQGGGMYSSRFVSDARKQASPFFERDSAGARLSLANASWWYLPHKILGFETGYGNLPLPNVLVEHAHFTDVNAEGVAAYSESANVNLIDEFYRDTPRWSSYKNLIYLVEMRMLHLIQALWFPLCGVVGLGVLLTTESTRPIPPHRADGDLDRLRLFWLVSAVSFGTSVAFVFFANTEGGNGVFWKWALTRVLEPGLCLATLAIVVALDRITLAFDSPSRRRNTWIAVVLLMSFGPLYRIFCFDL